MCVACSELCFFLPRYIIRDSTFSPAVLNNAHRNHAFYTRVYVSVTRRVVDWLSLVDYIIL